MSEIRSNHPRLLVADDGFASLRRNAESPVGSVFAERIVYDARKMLGAPPQPRTMEGRRLLQTCRFILYRINTLAVAYHLTEEAAFAERAIREMTNAAAFPDWNPSHFLDVGEMTLALSIGYDWLYDKMTEAERELVARAIVEKGLRPSFASKQWWVRGTNNWNPVCHAGMVAGALTVMEREPELARKTVERAVNGVPVSMKASYSPNGAYPEGPMYWTYGTEFTVMLLALLEGAFGHDFGLATQTGFDKTGDFYQASSGPSGLFFNYADCARKRESSIAMIYLAQKFNRPDWFGKEERSLLLEYAKKRPKAIHSEGNRLLPLSLLFMDIPEATPEAAPLSYYSGGRALVPIGICRSDATPQAAYLGIKGGSPSGPHGHMDGGSFVFESLGHRWALDLGMENYTAIELAGIRLWDGAQNGGRWTLFRLNSESHNIPVIDGAPQNVKGKAVFRHFGPLGGTLDLTTLYTPALTGATRKFTLLPERGLRIVDTFEGLHPGAHVRWQMCTDAEIHPQEDGSLLLSHGKTSMRLTKNTPDPWDIFSADTLIASAESKNPGVTMIRFHSQVLTGGSLLLEVNLSPKQ